MKPIRYIILAAALLLTALCFFIVGVKFGSSWGVRSAAIRDATVFHQIALMIRANKAQDAQDLANSEVKSFLPLISETSNSQIFRYLPGTNIAGIRSTTFLDYFLKYRPKPVQFPKDFFMRQSDMPNEDQIKMTAWLDSAYKNDSVAFALIDIHLRSQKKPNKTLQLTPSRGASLFYDRSSFPSTRHLSCPPDRGS